LVFRYSRICAIAGSPLQSRRADSIAATSIFLIPIIASNACLAAARSGSLSAFINARSVICQELPHLSLHSAMSEVSTGSRHPRRLGQTLMPTLKAVKQ
jgi:hypothetical protein